VKEQAYRIAVFEGAMAISSHPLFEDVLKRLLPMILHEVPELVDL
jgi:hypothetical protein